MPWVSDIGSAWVVGIASMAAQTGPWHMRHYAASKAGLIGFSKSVAKELASRGITVNVIAPGFIDTDMTAVLSDEQKKGILEHVPLGRLGSGDDIANAALFLASDTGAYITGQVLTIDGDGRIDVYNSHGQTHCIVDVFGYFMVGNPGDNPSTT